MVSALSGVRTPASDVMTACFTTAFSRAVIGVVSFSPSVKAGIMPSNSR